MKDPSGIEVPIGASEWRDPRDQPRPPWRCDAPGLQPTECHYSVKHREALLKPVLTGEEIALIAYALGRLAGELHTDAQKSKSAEALEVHRCILAKLERFTS